MQDPESVPPLERNPHELRQWDMATGKLRWSETVAGAGLDGRNSGQKVSRDGHRP